ncbi:hypothetical protein IQ235_10465 [Oscillatoriales cyanobacterium LEGE 11467]|uniref:Uncharacterized protein n=1 Tax=Zarconia navalis LEGE 11467 TaxID=1828826 RepID=A0A928Z9Y0_9CYAN|nr:hypothetical protein [Zarconia navalis]MBE9041201.1 hypothetical protein [Zarconia navalis LEGE 11467]
MKYFFLSEGWEVDRVWGSQGLWNATAWRRFPQIDRTNLCIVDRVETLWLYRVEDAVLMVEVKPIDAETSAPDAIGQVVLKRLMSAELALQRLTSSSAICQLNRNQN